MSLSNKGIARVVLGLCLCLAATTGPSKVEAKSTGTETGGVASAQTVVRPQGAALVPETFLRSWDPVTFFFDKDTGPKSGGAEDRPERFVTMSPAHPGAYRWINARTLQFRPTEAWPPLSRFSWRFGGRTHGLTTLMAPPVSTYPANGTTNLNRFESFTLSFSEPFSPEALSKMLDIEWRPLPGIDASPSRRLTTAEFDVKAMERATPADKALYVVTFREPAPEGTRVVVRLRLSLDDTSNKSLTEMWFDTSPRFRPTRLGCGDGAGFVLSAGGVRYGRDQALTCRGDDRKIQVSFSGVPSIDPVSARNLIRFTPNVDGLTYETAGNTVIVRGRFLPETIYRVGLYPTAIYDSLDRPLDMNKESEAYAYFPKSRDFLEWRTSQGVVERLGPQMVPLRGRGDGRLDLRIHKIDPFDRSFWPFPDKPVAVDEDVMPPGPGEEPAAHESATRYISATELARQLAILGSPSISEIVATPLEGGMGAAKFGLDLEPFLTRISGAKAPGTYLVGVRRLASAGTRDWVRIQVTDLSITAVEEAEGLRFAVTSLATGKPLAGASIAIEGADAGEWAMLRRVETDASGMVSLKLPFNGNSRTTRLVRRIVVRHRDDVLVLDPSRPPESFVDNHWRNDGGNWLQWTQSFSSPLKQSRRVCHIFTERPVYKPEHPVHIKAYVRDHLDGALSPASTKGTLVIDGPGDNVWRYDVSTDNMGSVYKLFDAETDATGRYTARLQVERGSCAVSFSKEAYRLPRFEVGLFAPKTVRLDEPFTAKMTATYYAGGVVADRPVDWRVTQFPYAWSPIKKAGYYFSSDARFSGSGEWRSTPTLTRRATTDDGGAAELPIDPTNEATAQPRRYVIEATVTGADDQTVTNTEEVLALPPFVIGMKVPRYLEKAKMIAPEVVAVGQNGDLLDGQSLTVRLIRRQWSSILQASDFTSGEAKYLTQVVDETVEERKITSATEPSQPEFDVPQAGVYIVEVEGHDKLGRAQTVRVDLFVGGDQPVTWSRPPAQVFKVSTDKADYVPGEKATVILESPFQNARALAIVENPDGSNDYSWVNVRNGKGVFSFSVARHHMPEVPVHFVLMRGRVGAQGQGKAKGLDLGKPTTIAASHTVKVSTAAHKVDVALDYPDAALPGQEIEVKIALKDRAGTPLPGDVTLWLVDQAVLALGKEQPLDPLGTFVIPAKSSIAIRDSRNSVMGWLPLEEQPGGGIDGAASASLLDKVTIRKNFSPVPFYDPSIRVGADGKATVRITLPDNLTNFKIRAKVVSGADRFGFGTGHLRVRLPVLVQPALPRFVRPGDTFVASAIGRVVEGKGGAGGAEIKVDGLSLDAADTKAFEWAINRPHRLDFAVAVPTPPYRADGRMSRDTVKVTIGVERKSDGASDAFSVDLPLLPDRRPEIRREISDLVPGTPMQISGVGEPYRTGTFKRSLMVSGEPAVLKMAAGLDHLFRYPFGCTEQQVSAARGFIAASRFGDLLESGVAIPKTERIVDETLAYLKTVTGPNDLVSFWPGSKGYVALTAWSVQFMVEARQAGYDVDAELLDTLLRGLRNALRSGFAELDRGGAYEDRVWALAALTMAGQGDPGYGAELVRRSQFLNAESLALVTWALSRSEAPDSVSMKSLYDNLWKLVSFKERDGKMRYFGLQGPGEARGAQILPSETRALAEILRATATAEGRNVKADALLDALVRLGSRDGWGSTNANAAALTALSEFLSQGNKRPVATVSVALAETSQTLTTGGDAVLASVTLDRPEAVDLKTDQPLGLRVVETYVPSSLGSEVAEASDGFVVTRSLHKIVADGPSEQFPLKTAGETLNFAVGDVVEDRTVVVNPTDRTQVAVVIPLAAGFEGLNPALATAPPEAQPDAPLTLVPSYTAFLDDRVAYFYDDLPKGTYHFAFRAKATVRGRFTQPPAYAEMMYDGAVFGRGNAVRIDVSAGAQGPANDAAQP